MSKMKLVRILDLVGQPVAGRQADIRSRNADGSLRWNHQRTGADIDTKQYLVTMKSVELRNGKGDESKWLYWKWEPRRGGYLGDCGYSGVRLDAIREGKDYYLLIAEV